MIWPYKQLVETGNTVIHFQEVKEMYDNSNIYSMIGTNAYVANYLHRILDKDDWWVKPLTSPNKGWILYSIYDLRFCT